MRWGKGGALACQKSPAEFLARGWGRALLALLVAGSTACGGSQRPAELPPPTYEQHELPPWEPEPPPAAPVDPLEGEFEGEWADEPPGSPEGGAEQPADEPPEDQGEGGDSPAPTTPPEGAPVEPKPAEDAPPAP